MPTPDPCMVRATVAVDTLVELSQRMLDAAEGGDWSAVERLDQDRRSALRELAAEAAAAGNLEEQIVRLRDVAAMDGRLRRIAETARRAALDDVRRVRERIRGSAAYQAQAGRFDGRRPAGR